MTSSITIIQLKIFPQFAVIYSLLKCPFYILMYFCSTSKSICFSEFWSLSWCPFLRKITFKNASKRQELLIVHWQRGSKQGKLWWRRCGPYSRVLFYLLFTVIFWSLLFVILKSLDDLIFPRFVRIESSVSCSELRSIQSFNYKRVQ